MIRLPAGNLRRVIVIQSKGTATDSFGGTINSWSNFATGVRAEVAPLQGKELIAAQAAQSSTTVKFKMRYLAGVTQSMRVVYGGKNYDITAVIDVDEMHREMHILATTGASEG